MKKMIAALLCLIIPAAAYAASAAGAFGSVPGTVSSGALGAVAQDSGAPGAAQGSGAERAEAYDIGAFQSEAQGSGAERAEAYYSDVPQEAAYSEAVRSVTERGIMNGTGGGKFSPDVTFTRAQLAAVLYRMAGSPPVTGSDTFTDTEDGAWYSDAVLWCSQEGIVKGLGGGLFGTDDPVTQEQAAVLLHRSAGSPPADAASSDRGPEGSSPEVPADTSDYAAEAAAWALGNGIAGGPGFGAFSPRASMSRAQTACMLSAFCAYGESAKSVPGDDAAAPNAADGSNEEEKAMILKIDGREIPVIWEDNRSVDALAEIAKTEGIKSELSPYGGFEQVGPLGTRIVRDDVQTTTKAGDIVLYSGDQIVIFYGSNSWAYTRLGRVDGMSAAELKELLGGKGVTLTLE